MVTCNAVKNNLTKEMTMADANVTGTETPPSDRTRLRQLPKRAQYDEATMYAILDAALLCHVRCVIGRQPLACSAG